MNTNILKKNIKTPKITKTSYKTKIRFNMFNPLTKNYKLYFPEKKINQLK